MLGFQVYLAIFSQRTLRDTRYLKGEQRTINRSRRTHASPIDVHQTTSRHLCLIINPTFHLIKHTQEHMKGGNSLWTDVVGCLTPSPRITKSPNPSLVQDPVFMHILIKIIKPSRYRWLITPSISRWLVATSNLVLFVPIVMSTNMPEHTHTFSHVYTICSPQHTTQKKRDFVEPTT